MLLGLLGDQVRRGADFEEFIQVAGNNAQVAQSLQQWHVGTQGPVEYAFIERKNAVIAVK